MEEQGQKKHWVMSHQDTERAKNCTGCRFCDKEKKTLHPAAGPQLFCEVGASWLAGSADVTAISLPIYS